MLRHDFRTECRTGTLRRLRTDGRSDRDRIAAGGKLPQPADERIGRRGTANRTAVRTVAAAGADRTGARTVHHRTRRDGVRRGGRRGRRYENPGSRGRTHFRGAGADRRTSAVHGPDGASAGGQLPVDERRTGGSGARPGLDPVRVERDGRRRKHHHEKRASGWRLQHGPPDVRLVQHAERRSEQRRAERKIQQFRRAELQSYRRTPQGHGIRRLGRLPEAGLRLHRALESVRGREPEPFRRLEPRFRHRSADRQRCADYPRNDLVLARQPLRTHVGIAEILLQLRISQNRRRAQPGTTVAGLPFPFAGPDAGHHGLPVVPAVYGQPDDARSGLPTQRGTRLEPLSRPRRTVGRQDAERCGGLPEHAADAREMDDAERGRPHGL